jgi:hypothetical protein
MLHPIPRPARSWQRKTAMPSVGTVLVRAVVITNITRPGGTNLTATCTIPARIILGTCQDQSRQALTEHQET